MMTNESQGQSNSTEQYDAFKDFARRLIAVPKQEIDEAAKTIEPQKKGRKRKERESEK